MAHALHPFAFDPNRQDELLPYLYLLLTKK